jgi:aspartate 1-decarboxylase
MHSAPRRDGIDREVEQMERLMLKSKIHRATITGLDLDYEGSITIDEELLEKADILQGEQVHVLNINNTAFYNLCNCSSARFRNYVIK